MLNVKTKTIIHGSNGKSEIRKLKRVNFFSSRFRKYSLKILQIWLGVAVVFEGK